MDKIYKYALGETVYYQHYKHTITGAKYDNDNKPRYLISGNSFWEKEHELKTPAEYWNAQMEESKRRHQEALDNIVELTKDIKRYRLEVQRYRTNYIMCNKEEK